MIFKDIFSYDDRPIFKDVSAEIKEMTAIVDPSGSARQHL